MNNEFEHQPNKDGQLENWLDSLVDGPQVSALLKEALRNEEVSEYDVEAFDEAFKYWFTRLTVEPELQEIYHKFMLVPPKHLVEVITFPDLAESEDPAVIVTDEFKEKVSLFRQLQKLFSEHFKQFPLTREKLTPTNMRVLKDFLQERFFAPLGIPDTKQEFLIHLSGFSGN